MANPYDLIDQHKARLSALSHPYTVALSQTKREHQVLSDEAFAALRASTDATIAQLESQHAVAEQERDRLREEAERIDALAREVHAKAHQQKDIMNAAEGQLFSVRNDHVRFHEAEAERRHYRALMDEESRRRDAECLPYKADYQALTERLQAAVADACAYWGLVHNQAPAEFNRAGGFAERCCIDPPQWLPKGQSYTEPQPWMTEEQASEWVELQRLLAESKRLLLEAYDLSAYACSTQVSSLEAYAKSIHFDGQKRYVELGGTKSGNANVYDHASKEQIARSGGDTQLLADIVDADMNQSNEGAAS